MNKHLLAAALAAVLSAAVVLPARAVSFEGALTQGGTVVVDYSAIGLLSFDIDFANTAPAVLSFLVQSGDVAGGQPLAMNAILRNFAGTGFAGYELGLGTGVFGLIGSVTRPSAAAPASRWPWATPPPSASTRPSSGTSKSATRWVLLPAPPTGR